MTAAPDPVDPVCIHGNDPATCEDRPDGRCMTRRGCSCPAAVPLRDEAVAYLNTHPDDGYSGPSWRHVLAVLDAT